jgi:hypothetical protein
VMCTSFSNKKKPNCFGKKIGVEYGNGKCNHIHTCGHMRLGLSWGEGGRVDGDPHYGLPPILVHFWATHYHIALCV